MTQVEPRMFRTKGGISNGPFNKLMKYYCGSKGPTGFGSKSTAEQVSASWSGAGKVAIITGSNTGLGLESARALALRGCEVFMAIRDPAKGQKAVAELVAKHPEVKDRLVVMECDLCSIASARKFVQNFKATGKPLNVLMLNASIMGNPFTLSVDGYETQFATNHLGQFILATELLDTMTQTATASGIQGRVIVFSSSAHFMGHKKTAEYLDKINDPKFYSPMTTYGSTKLCSILFARSLQQQIEAKNLNLACVVLHPGAIDTNLQQHQQALRVVLKIIKGVTMKTVPQGAATQTFLATAEHVDGGEYYVDCNIAPSHKESHDMDLADKLWKLSEEMIKQGLSRILVKPA